MSQVNREPISSSVLGSIVLLPFETLNSYLLFLEWHYMKYTLSSILWILGRAHTIFPIRTAFAILITKSESNRIGLKNNLSYQTDAVLVEAIVCVIFQYFINFSYFGRSLSYQWMTRTELNYYGLTIVSLKHFTPGQTIIWMYSFNHFKYLS